MFANVNYNDPNGRTRKLRLRAGQRVSVGASFSADIVLRDTQGVASEHAEILFKHQKCSIKNLTGKPERLLVNGQPTQKAELSNGDAIEIGFNQLDIEMESVSTPEAVSAVAATTIAAATVVTKTPAREVTVDSASPVAESPSSQFERHPNGTVVITFEGGAELIDPIITQAKSPWACHLLCNHKLSQLKCDPPSELNYLSESTSKISESNDLYLVDSEDKNELLPLYLKYRKAGAGLLGLNGPGMQNVDIAEQLKYLATWFMVPASLKFHAINGSSLLLNKIFGLFEILVLPNANGSEDWILLNDPAVDGLESFVDKIKGASNDLGN